MTTNFIRAALACAVLAITAQSAMASNKPIPGIDVIVKKNPGGNAITATTDADGQIVLKGLEPGDYVIEIDGKSLVKAMDGAGPINANGGIGSKVRAEIKFEGSTNVESLLGNFSVETCACRTSQPMRIGFTIPDGVPQEFHSNLRLTWYSPSD